MNALIEAMRGPPLDIRWKIVAPAAARALGRISDPAAVSALTRALQGAGDLQFGAREALEMIDAPTARAATAAQDERIATDRIAQLTDPTASTRVQACLDLYSLGVKSAAPALVKALRDPDANVRAAAASALAQTRDTATATEPLLALLSDATVNVRIAAAEALAALPKPPAAVAIPSGGDAVLIQALDDKNVRVRAAAATVLGKWRYARAAPVLAQRITEPRGASRGARGRLCGIGRHG